MMEFIVYKSDFILIYSPDADSFEFFEGSPHYIPNGINRNLKFDEFIQRKESHRLKNTFYIEYKNFMDTSDLEEDDIFSEGYYISIGKIEKNYIHLDKDVFNIEHNIYFSKSIEFTQKFFIAYHDISIISRIDKVIDKDLYIEDNLEYEYDGHISLESFFKILKFFPNKTEIEKYSNYRISTNLVDFFNDQNKDIHKNKFEKYISNKSSTKGANYPKLSDKNKSILSDEAIANNLIALKDELKKLIDNSSSLIEKEFQEYILQTIKILFPKYIYAKREVRIKGMDKHDKIPDFILIDYSGFVDALEIKKPEAQLLLDSKSRNNYVPSKGLSSAVQQLEKYIICLNRNGLEGEKKLQKKFSKIIPEDLNLKCINSKGILIMGDTKGFNVQQKNDFEIIKRQYKDIMDIYTYDELLAMLDNAIASFK